MLENGYSKPLGKIEDIIKSYFTFSDNIQDGIRHKLPENNFGFFDKWFLKEVDNFNVA